MRFITVRDVKYLVISTVLAKKVSEVTSENLKKRYSLVDTVLKNGDTLYLCMTCIETEFEEVDDG
tara:strand:- start:1124 stop:1318 length:195 start_codon:yes stop_codon:yes gene_type:complete